eukprot:11263628-Alexandrium_andersonii.AAC.1
MPASARPRTSRGEPRRCPGRLLPPARLPGRLQAVPHRLLRGRHRHRAPAQFTLFQCSLWDGIGRRPSTPSSGSSTRFSRASTAS